MVIYRLNKTSWADDVDELGQFYAINVLCMLTPLVDQPKIEDSVDENGIRTIIEYTLNDEGKKVKVNICVELLVC
jgi:translation initiation factor 3 subunit G